MLKFIYLVSGSVFCWCVCVLLCYVEKLHTQNCVSALQLEGFFVVAEVVDEEPKLVDVLKTLRHHHLLVDQVRLGQVGARLAEGGKHLCHREIWSSRSLFKKYISFFFCFIL